jgi:hypothetical protein
MPAVARKRAPTGHGAGYGEGQDRLIQYVDLAQAMPGKNAEYVRTTIGSAFPAMVLRGPYSPGPRSACFPRIGVSLKRNGRSCYEA